MPQLHAASGDHQAGAHRDVGSIPSIMTELVFGFTVLIVLIWALYEWRNDEDDDVLG
jgi:hypothetical protein